MKLYHTLKGALLSAFTSPKPEIVPPMPQTFPVPQQWMESLTRHIVKHRSESGENMIAAAKWDVVIDIVREATEEAPITSAQKAFLRNLGSLADTIRKTPDNRKDAETGLPVWRNYIDLKTDDLIGVYRSSHLFEEMSRVIAARETDISQVIPLKGAAIFTNVVKAEFVVEFGKKYIQMMEGDLLAQLIRGEDKAKMRPEPRIY